MAERTPYGAPVRFITEIVFTYSSDQCLEWPYSRNKSGYGTINRQGRSVLVNRFVCELAHGQPPSSKHEAAHNCGNRACCNPAHLRWATHAENQADKLVHGTARAPRGEMHGRAKLTADDVVQIRRMLPDKTRTEIGKIFGVSHRTISAISSGKNWGWL